MFTFMIQFATILLGLVSFVVASPIPIRRSWIVMRQTDDADSVTVTDFNGGSGDGTYYATGLGACGITNVDTDMIAAIGEDFFDQYATHMGVSDANPNSNPICNKKVTATYEGKSVTVAITDRCAGCAIPYSLDFSPSAFAQLADASVGRIHNITWVWADSDTTSSSSSSTSSTSSSTSSSSSNSTSTSDSDSTTDSSSSTAASPSSSTSSDSDSSASSSAGTAAATSTDGSSSPSSTDTASTSASTDTGDSSPGSSSTGQCTCATAS